MYEIQTEQHGNILIMRLLGSVLLPDAIQFSRQLADLTASPTISQAVLDMSQVTAIDNACLGVLVSMSARNRGGGPRLNLLAPAPHVVQALKDAKIDGFFPTFDYEQGLMGYLPVSAGTLEQDFS